MQPKPAIRRPVQVLFLVGIFIFSTLAGTPALSAPALQATPEPKPERNYSQPLSLDPTRRIPLESSAAALNPERSQSPQFGEGWSRAVFQRLVGDSWDIVLRDGGSGSETAIASSPANEIQPRLRRGGDRVAYISDQVARYQLWTMNPDGSDQRQLTSGSASSYPNWSPDGTRIVFERQIDRDEAAVFVINADGSGLTQLTPSEGYDGMPSWAPDGSHIIFVSNRSGQYNIWRMNPDGSNPIKLNNIPYSMDPYYTPDGRFIFYDAYDFNGFSRVYGMLAASGYTHTAFGAGNVDCVVTGMSADGKQVLVSQINWVYYENSWYWTDVKLSGLTYNYTEITHVTDYTTSGLDLYMSWRSMDLQAPDLRLQPLPAESGNPIRLRITGGDTGGSGIARYSLQFRQDGGEWYTSNDFTPLSTPLPEVSWEAGTLFEFRIRGEDHAGNREDWPATPDAATRIESQPPHTRFIDPPAYAGLGGLLYYQATDVGGSQVKNYDVQRFNNDTQTWEMLSWETTSTEIGVGGLPGTSWSVRVRARDTAGNEEPWPEAGDPGYHTVQVYTSAISGTAHAAAGNPISGVEVQVADGTLLAQENHDPGGAYASYVIYDTYVNLAYSKPGYGSLPWSTYADFKDHRLDLYLPPADNLVQDSDLVLDLASPANPWAVSGSLPITPASSPEPCHTGSCTALGSTSLIFTSFETVFPADLHAVDLRTFAGSDNSLHLIAHNGAELFYRQRTAAGAWLPYETIHTAATEGIQAAEVKTDTGGVVHLAYLHDRHVFYLQRSLAGAWSSPRRISGEATAYTDWTISDLLQVDAQGGVHAMWQCSWDGLYSDVCYARRTPAGSWSAPEVVETSQGAQMQIRFRLTSSGIVHAAWSRESASPESIRYARRSVDGTWSIPVELGVFADFTLRRFIFELDANQRPMLAWVVYGGYQNYLVRQRWQQANGSWSALQERDLGTYYNLHLDVKLAYDSQARLHILINDYFDYFTLPRGGELDVRGVIVPNVFSVNGFYVTPDEKIHLMYQLYNQEGMHYSLLDGSQIRDTLILTDYHVYSDEFRMFVDNSQTPHFLYDREEIIAEQPIRVWDHTTLARAAGAESGELSQTVAIPAGMNQAGLSLLYLLKGGQAAGSSGLSAWIEAQDGATEVWQTHSGNSNWQHAWVDVSDFAGETVRVILRMDQAAGEVRLYGYLDEVSLGTGYGDAWLGGEAQERKLQPGEIFAVQVPYGNLGGFGLPGGVIEVSLPAGLELLESSPACSGGPLVVTCGVGALAARAEGVLSLSLRSTPGAPVFQRLEIGLQLTTTGTELELLNNQGVVGVRLANELYLPAIGNWWAGE